jgi:hypothetical protein
MENKSVAPLLVSSDNRHEAAKDAEYMHSNKKPSKAKGKKKKDEKLKGERPDAEFGYPARFRCNINNKR